MIDCSISIVNFNSKDLLEKCIRSIYGYVKAVSFEIIVIDNGSTDHSLWNIAFKFPQVKIIYNRENLLFTKASNQGLQASQGRYAITLNPDCYFEDDSISKMVRYMDRNKDVGACGPTFLNIDGSIQSVGHRFPGLLYPFFQLLFINTILPDNPVREARNYYENKLQEVDAMGGGGIMVRQGILWKVGYLDEGFPMYFEDTDWCKRIRSYGWKIMHIPEAKVYHYGGESTVKVDRNKFERILYKSMLYYYRKYYGVGVSIILRILLYGFHYPVLFVVRGLKIIGGKGDDL